MYASSLAFLPLSPTQVTNITPGPVSGGAGQFNSPGVEEAGQPGSKERVVIHQQDSHWREHLAVWLRKRNLYLYPGPFAGCRVDCEGPAHCLRLFPHCLEAEATLPRQTRLVQNKALPVVSYGYAKLVVAVGSKPYPCLGGLRMLSDGSGQ